MLCSGNSDSVAAESPPTCFRLPKLGERDPYFSLTKFTYLRLEKAGCINLIRVVVPGNVHGSVLVNYKQVESYLAGLAAKEAE